MLTVYNRSAPQAVVEQHWRQDEDGTYIIFMHSVGHARAREAQHPWYSWFQPLRFGVRPCYGYSPIADLHGCCLEHGDER